MKKSLPNVLRFFEQFDCKRFVTIPPKEIEEFLEKELLTIREFQWGGKDVLEVGCGYGRLMKIMATSARRISGIDFSHTQLAKAKLFLNDAANTNCFLMNADDLCFDDETFDVATCLNATMCNMPNIELAVLYEMKRVVKHGGEIMLTVLSELAKPAQIVNYQNLGLNIISVEGNAIITAEGLYSRRFSRGDLDMLLQTVDGLSYTVEPFCQIGYLVIAKKL